MDGNFNGISVFLLLIGSLIVVISFFIQQKSKKKPLSSMEDKEITSDDLEEMEEATSEKLMAINEYSNYVLQEIEKKHKELLFMYQMMNEKKQAIQPNIRLEQQEKVINPVKTLYQETNEIKPYLNEKTNNNKEILKMHKEGSSVKEIAKHLGLGIGEVQLVLDLFKEVTHE